MDRRTFLQRTSLLLGASVAPLRIAHANNTLPPRNVLSPEDLARMVASLQQRYSDFPLVVHVQGRIAPGAGADPKLQSFIPALERFGVVEVVEHSDRGPFQTPPMRVGQIDPAGIIYRSLQLAVPNTHLPPPTTDDSSDGDAP